MAKDTKLTPDDVAAYEDFSSKTDAEWAHVESDAERLGGVFDRVKRAAAARQKPLLDSLDDPTTEGR